MTTDHRLCASKLAEMRFTPEQIDEHERKLNK